MNSRLRNYFRLPAALAGAADQPAVPPQPVPPPETDQLKTPVNAFSNAVDPRKLYPLHFDLLMHELHTMGEAPEMWRVLDATETRLDEHGMEIEFTLVRHGTDLVWRRGVLVSGGRLVRIITR